MSVAADASAQPFPATPALIAWRRALLHGRLPMYLACTALALVVNYLFGKEMAWDTLNYHMYAGFAGVHDRLNQDYFAAGPQSYINPYAYVPFYALVSSGLPAVLVASVLAVLHSVILWLTFELALVVFPSGGERHRVTLGISAHRAGRRQPRAAAAESAQVSQTSPPGELVLAAWLLLATAARIARQHAGDLRAGLLLGVATALKMTNAVHAIAAAAMLIMLPRPLASKLRYGALYGAAAWCQPLRIWRARPGPDRLEGKSRILSSRPLGRRLFAPAVHADRALAPPAVHSVGPR